MDSLSHWLQFDSFSAADLLVVLALVVLEGLLSCDNAVVLALQVRHLPPEQRGRALRYGILGAYLFRIIALLLATWIMGRWYLKIFGGVYLCFLAVRHFVSHDDEPAGERVVRRFFGLGAFWSTVIAVEMTDIVFSVDSIAAAVALSDKLWVLIAGSFLGIFAMRFAAQGFVTLLDRFPRLEGAAFVAVAVVGLKLLLDFPADVCGLTQPFPATATYATAREYETLVHDHAPPWLHVPHTLTITSGAAPEPDPAAMERAALAQLTPDQRNDAAQLQKVREHTQNEHRRAESNWNLHHRPLIEIEGWLSSLIVMAVFACGFALPQPRSKKSDEAGSTS